MDNRAVGDKALAAGSLCYTDGMPSQNSAPGSEMPRQAATGHDAPRPVATDPSQYTLTIEDALLRYEHAGYPRTPRSVQRYCAKGDLDCLRQETTFGAKFMTTEQSVARHIAQIAELASATSRDLSRQGTAGEKGVPATHQVATDAATGHDRSRPDATSRGVPPVVAAPVAPAPIVEDRYVKQLESENAFLREQVQRKDTQIGELTERAKETNYLIKGLQNLVLQLSPGRSEAQPGAFAEPREENPAA